ncbi:MAG: hypothetical protein HY914_11550 [Desulfomonile tiedjei]|nr:hypothetical protein [Desulfomonile tiedjei]
MVTPEKRRISARQLLSDIQAGMDGEQLSQKHGLSDRSRESVLHKLAAAGLITEEQVQRLSVSQPVERDTDREDAQAADLRKCPACDALLASGSPECPVCGVVVAKFVARQEQGSRDRESRRDTSASPGKRWLLLSCMVTLVVVAGGYFVFRLHDKTQEKPKTAAATGIRQVEEESSKRPGAAARVPAPKDRKAQETPKAPNIFAMNAGELLELKFVPEGFPLGLAVSQGSGGVHFFGTPDPNQGFKKFPPEADSRRYYDQITIAGQSFLMITDESNPPKIYLDANRNGDMTDDPGPFAGEGPNAAPSHYTLELPYQGEELSVPYRLWLFPSNMGGVRFYPTCYWLGQVELNGNPFKVVTFDGNADGDYSNDPVVVDLDDDGKAADSERLKPGQSLTIDGRELKLLAIAPSGRWVRVQY